MRRLAAFLAVLAVLVPAGATGARAPVRLTLGYSVPPRYGLPVAVAPAAWPALVTVRWPDGRPCTGTYTWTIGGHANTFVQQKDSLGRPTCVFRFDGFPALDHPYRVDVAATRAGVHGAGRTQVTIHDTLVVGLGDSNASGEGNPDHAIAPVRWQDRRCHRSANGFEALTASRLEKASDKSSVTYIPLACSGAAIITGLLAPYAGIEPVGTTKVPAQIQAMKAQLGTRTPDAVLVSIGINDLGFGNVAFFCFDDGVDAKAAATVDCWTKRYPSATSPVTLKAWVRARAALLPGRYAQLAAAFQRAGIPASKIYVTEYPNGTRDAAGATCNPLVPYLDGTAFGFPLRGEITRAEAAQAETEVVQTVNRELARAATAYGWHFVSGIAAATAPHGLCAAQPWFVSVAGSLIAQHDAFGTLHPNALGQQATTTAVLAALPF